MSVYSEILLVILIALSLIIQLTNAMNHSSSADENTPLLPKTDETESAMLISPTTDKKGKKPKFLTTLKDGAKTVGNGVAEGFKQLGRNLRDIFIFDGQIYRYVELKSVTLHLEDKAKKKVDDDSTNSNKGKVPEQIAEEASCEAQIVDRHYFIFDWEQCNWVKYGEQRLILEVVYKNGTSPDIVTRHQLWNSRLFPARVVKDWLKGEGKFLLDHDRFPQQQFYKRKLRNPREGVCFCLPSITQPVRHLGMPADDVYLDEDWYSYPRIKEPIVQLERVTLLQWENRRAKKIVGDICKAVIVDNHYFYFDEQCKLLKKLDVHEAIKFLSLHVIYKYDLQPGTSSNMVNQQHPPRTFNYRYDLWDKERFPAALVKDWLQGKGQFWLNHNGFPREMLWKATFRNPRPGLCYVWPTVRGDYQRINESVELMNVRLFRWQNGKEAGNPAIDSFSSCDADIVENKYFFFDWTKQQCNWVNFDEQLLSLKVGYKYIYEEPEKNIKKDHGAERVIFVRYDLWDTKRFSVPIVKKWLQGKGQFWLNHNANLREMFLNARLDNPREGLCLVKPTIRTTTNNNNKDDSDSDEIHVVV